MHQLTRVFRSLKTAFTEFLQDDCPTRAAALAYYALFSIPPVILIAILIAARIWGAEAARDNLREQLTQILDPWGTDLVLRTLEAGQNRHRSRIATLVGGLVLIVGSSGVMMQLQSALNRVWNCPREAKPFRFRNVLIRRALCFLMVLAVSGLLLISLAATTAMTATMNYLAPYLPSQSGLWLQQSGNLCITFLLIVTLLASLFRWMPDCLVQWRDVWGGAVMTAILFLLGKELLAWYLGSVNLAGYGGAGALVLLLMWIYYTSMILLFGAELTQVWAQNRGRCKKSASQPVLPSEPNKA